MYYLIIDLEASCFSDQVERDEMEIIEIGAVMSDDKGNPIDEFQTFVQPVRNLILSDFCRELTHICQDDVNNAPFFKSAMSNLLAWIGTRQPLKFCSWGFYDYKQFEKDCLYHGIEFPDVMKNHVNLKNELARIKPCKRMGMSRALTLLNIPLMGNHHRGIDDAKNIAQIFKKMVQEMNYETKESKPNP
jgi:inhibitor of KinA sporulation pathway (predicted exonuclease)